MNRTGTKPYPNRTRQGDGKPGVNRGQHSSSKPPAGEGGLCTHPRAHARGAPMTGVLCHGTREQIGREAVAAQAPCTRTVPECGEREVWGGRMHAIGLLRPFGLLAYGGKKADLVQTGGAVWRRGQQRAAFDTGARGASCLHSPPFQGTRKTALRPTLRASRRR